VLIIGWTPQLLEQLPQDCVDQSIQGGGNVELHPAKKCLEEVHQPVLHKLIAPVDIVPEQVLKHCALVVGQQAQVSIEHVDMHLEPGKEILAQVLICGTAGSLDQQAVKGKHLGSAADPLEMQDIDPVQQPFQFVLSLFAAA
jgi:hypothetical protein